MRRNVARLKKISHSLQQTLGVVVDCMDWQSKVRSGLALLVLDLTVLLLDSTSS